MESYFENDLKIEPRKYVESEPANEKDENYDKILSNIRKYFSGISNWLAEKYWLRSKK